MERENVDILLFIEHVARELDVACAVKHLVGSRHGLKLEIASTAWNLPATLRRFAPKVIALPYTYSINDFAIHNIVPVWTDAMYVNLAYEQVFQSINKSYKRPRDKFAHSCVLHVVWGDFARQFMQDAGVEEKNIVINGNQSYMLYCEPYCRYFEARPALAKEFGIDPAKRWVFVPENYGVGFLNDRQMRTRYGDFQGGEAEDFRNFAAESFRQAAGWWCKAAALPNTEVILRPRPATPKEMIVQALKASSDSVPSNLHVIKDKTVRQWILASDFVTSSYSTTLIEASVAGKPLLMHAPLPFPEYLKADWYQYAPMAHTADEFLAAIQQCDPRSCQALQTWARKEMLSRGDVLTNIADLLAGVCKKTHYHPGAPGKGILATRVLEKNPIRKARGILSRVYHAMKRKPGKTWEADELTPADLAARQARWAKVLG